MLAALMGATQRGRCTAEIAAEVGSLGVFEDASEKRVFAKSERNMRRWTGLLRLAALANDPDPDVRKDARSNLNAMGAAETSAVRLDAEHIPPPGWQPPQPAGGCMELDQYASSVSPESKEINTVRGHCDEPAAPSLRRTDQQRQHLALRVPEHGAAAVALEAQVSLSAVYRWCRQFDVDPGRKRYRSRSERRELALRVPGLGVDAVAVKAEASVSTVYGWCRQFDVSVGEGSAQSRERRRSRRRELALLVPELGIAAVAERADRTVSTVYGWCREFDVDLGEGYVQLRERRRSRRRELALLVPELGVAAVAERADRTVSTVQQWCREFHMEPQQRHYRSRSQRQELALLVPDMGIDAVAATAQASVSTVQRWCREFDVDLGEGRAQLRERQRLQRRELALLVPELGVAVVAEKADRSVKTVQRWCREFDVDVNAGTGHSSLHERRRSRRRELAQLVPELGIAAVAERADRTVSTVQGWCREFDVDWGAKPSRGSDERRELALLVPELGVAAVAEKAHVTHAAVYGWCREFSVAPTQRTSRGSDERRELALLVPELGVAAVAEKADVSAATVRKWCKEFSVASTQRVSRGSDERRRLALLVPELGVAAVAEKADVSAATVRKWCKEFSVASTQRVSRGSDERRRLALLVPELGVAAVAEKAQVTHAAVYKWCQEFDVAPPRRMRGSDERRRLALLVPELGVTAVAQKARASVSAVYGWCKEFGVVPPQRHEPAPAVAAVPAPGSATTGSDDTAPGAT